MGDEDDLAFALFLQDQFNNEQSEIVKPKGPTSLVDPAWEMIDPSPDIRQLFLQFNNEFFDGILGGVEVRWSPRMTLCAGLCCYEGRGGLCSIRLSEPLLKLRPRKDLVETLLHEMIHALLFVTQNNKDHDGHGPEFHKHMYRINNKAGTKISVYHNFHDEVNSYRQHWWKCNGPCQKWPPFYGVVKRAMNRAPAPRDTWWDDHKRKCGGEFTKVKEPENYGKKKSKSKKTKDDSNKKDKNIKNESKPNLPTFFDKMRKKQESNTTTDEDNSSDDGEGPAKNPRVDNGLPAGFQAFGGKGHVLGGSKTQTNRLPDKEIKKPLVSQKINERQATNATKVINKNSAILNQNKRNHNKDNKKKTQVASYTIVDAFARGKQDASACGSKEKPIDLCDEPAGSSNDVVCPSCQSCVPIHKINNHLDTCLGAL